MKNMKRNVLLIPFVAVLTLLVVSMASAALTNDVYTKFNGVTLSDSATMVGNVGDVVPLRITFNANESASDVRIKAYMEGHRDDVSVRSDRFDIEAGVTYTKLLSLELPSDADDLSETYTLYVEIVSSEGRYTEEYTVSMQRESYTLEVLSVDYTSRVEAGEVFPVSVVVKNTGYNRMDDTYVVVSIPALGVSARGYVGDLVSSEDGYDHEEDSMSKTVALMIPADAASGVYEMEVTVYNDDTETTSGSLIAVEGDDSDSDDEDGSDALSGDDGESASTPVVALTVILVIVFVVLLAVLVILLTKKGKPVEEVETSYY